MKFNELGLSDKFCKTLNDMGIIEATEIQEKSIKLVVEGKDIIGASKTGSGKTLAFSSGIIENVDKNDHIGALVMTPTRELAEQISDSIEAFSGGELKIVSVYGGVDINRQIQKIKRANVVVGTPGRIIDHLNRGTIDLGNIKILVLDEFDRMFDMGFINDVDKIISKCPSNRQTMLFSATISGDIEHLSAKYTNNAIEINAEVKVDASKLKQFYYDVFDSLKFSLLVHLLKNEDSDLVMIFCATRRNVDFVVKNLNNLGIESKAIHGGLDQRKRIRVLKDFHGKNKLNVLVCTDVAARGLDIKGVSHVYNYDVPRVSSDYVHRIGRTARAGENGKAITILASRDYENFSNLMNRENVKIIEKEMPKVKRVSIIKEERRGSRKSFKDKSRDDFKRSSGRDGRSRSRREMHKAVCEKCKSSCLVPFKPRSGGVLCSSCFEKKSKKRRRN